VEWSYFAQKCVKFHLQPSRFEKFSPGRNPRTPSHRGQRREKERRGMGSRVSTFKRGGRKAQERGIGRRK